MLKKSWHSKLFGIVALTLFLMPQFVFANSLCLCMWQDSRMHYSTSCLRQTYGVTDAGDSHSYCEQMCTSRVGEALLTALWWSDDSTDASQAQIAGCASLATLSLDPESEQEGIPEPLDAIPPELAIEIPGLHFSTAYTLGGKIKINWLGEYIQAVYTYLLSASLIVAIVFIMVRGGQYVLSSGGAADVGSAKKGITNAAVGIVLLLCVYLILFIVNPQLTNLEILTLDTVDNIAIDIATRGPGGSGVALSGNLTDFPEPYATIFQAAQRDGECSMDQGQYMLSPSGGSPNYGEHHWYDRGLNGERAEGRWQYINNMDWSAPFGNPIYASFKGVATYTKEKSKYCGNSIVLTGSGATITICHAKDFIGSSGTFEQNLEVEAGDIIGHVGGIICANETPVTSKYDSSTKAQGTRKCTSPMSNEDCDCQYTKHAGNTSGAHIHVSWSGQTDTHALLACMEDQSTIGDAAVMSTEESALDAYTEEEEDEVIMSEEGDEEDYWVDE
jgi:hypothetical protein